MYWAQALAAQTDDPALAARFGPVAAALSASEATIVAELAAVQGHAADIGGYYMPDPVKTAAVMRPSATLNAIISAV
jgi:isocitrate dehydrogenase